MDDDLDKLVHAVAVDQILLRVLLTEFVAHCVDADDKTGGDQSVARRDALNRLYSAVDHYRVPGADATEIDLLRESARGVLDALLSPPSAAR